MNDRCMAVVNFAEEGEGSACPVSLFSAGIRPSSISDRCLIQEITAPMMTDVNFLRLPSFTVNRPVFLPFEPQCHLMQLIVVSSLSEELSSLLSLSSTTRGDVFDEHARW